MAYISQDEVPSFPLIDTPDAEVRDRSYLINHVH